MPKEEISNKMIDQAAKAVAVQNAQQQQVGQLVGRLQSDAAALHQKRDAFEEELDAALLQAQLLCAAQGIDIDGYTDSDISAGEALMELNESELASTHVAAYTPLQIISSPDTTSWQDYMAAVDRYAQEYHIDLSGDVLTRLLTQDQTAALAKQLEEDYRIKEAHCDKYDYALAAFCGVAAGLVDSLFVGMPGESKLQPWADAQVDNFVMGFARCCKWSPAAENENNVASAISHLERSFDVNYDYASASRLGPTAKNIFNMSSTNHHIKSLAHSPDLVGLVFSIIEQFTGVIHFADGGRMIIFDRERQELVGKDFISKVFAAFCNWLGHCVSDVAGSYESRRKGDGHRGAGLPVPGFELLQFIGAKLPKKQQQEKMVLFSDLAVKMFENSYDARFGLAMKLPVLLNDLMTRACFLLKRVFYHHLTLKESIPLDWRVLRHQPELRRMLLVSYGCLCAVDITDAGIRTAAKGGDILEFALHLNFVAWRGFGFRCFVELRQQFFCKDALDLVLLDEDLENEWQRLLAS